MMNILFLCTGNSCRSQIAEGWAKQFAPAGWSIESAGIEAHGKNPRAIAVMQEAGVDISSQDSTRVTDAMFARADLVVTVCGHADEHCPALPTTAKKLHWPLNDPAKAEGNEEDVMQVFRSSRDDIKDRIKGLLAELRKQSA